MMSPDLSFILMLVLRMAIAAAFVVSAYQAIGALKSQILAGNVGADPAIRDRETLWQAMVVKPDLGISLEAGIAAARKRLSRSAGLVMWSSPLATCALRQTRPGEPRPNWSRALLRSARS